MSWIRKFRHISGLRTKLHEEAPGHMPNQAVAWGYKPPTKEGLPGQFKLLYTKSGYMSAPRDWRWYKPDQSFTEEDAWEAKDYASDERIKFIEQLNSKQYKKVEKFFETMPKLSHTVKVTNPNTNVESEIKIEGLQSFFG